MPTEVFLNTSSENARTVPLQLEEYGGWQGSLGSI